MVEVTYVRAVVQPGGPLFQYEVRGDQVVVTVAMDAANEEMVRAAEEMWNDILADMHPRSPLRLINCARERERA